MATKIDREFSEKFNKEYVRTRRINPKTADKIKILIIDILDHPRTGIGKPERLRHQSYEVWSRRIDHKNRLIYAIIGNTIFFESCTGHYGDH